MHAVGRKRKADEISLARRVFVAQAIVGKIAQLIVAEIENANRLPPAALLCAVALIEQGSVAAVRTEGDGRGKAVRAGNVTRDREREALAGWQMDAARIISGAPRGKHDKKGV